MATPKELGISRISTPPQERTAVPVLPRPEVKPTPVSPEPGRTPTRKSLIQRLARNLAIRIAFGGLVLASAGGYGAYRIAESNNTQHPPAVETISKENIIQLTKSSFTPVSPEQQQELWKNTKTVDLENHTFTIGFPVDQATIDKSPNLRMNQQFDAILPPIEKNKLEQEGVKNVITMSELPNGTEYKVIYDDARFDVSVILLAVAGVTQGQGSNSFTPAYTSYRLLFRDRETGTISSQAGISGLLAQPLVTTNPYPKDHHPVYEDGVPIKSGDSIMKLTTDLKDWDGSIGQPLPGQKGQFQMAVSYEQKSPYDSRIMLGIPLTTTFLKTPNGNLAVQQ